MLHPGVLVSQQVTTRYVLLVRQSCDGCVTIGSNRMYGGGKVCVVGGVIVLNVGSADTARLGRPTVA